MLPSRSSAVADAVGVLTPRAPARRRQSLAQRRLVWPARETSLPARVLDVLSASAWLAVPLLAGEAFDHDRIVLGVLAAVSFFAALGLEFGGRITPRLEHRSTFRDATLIGGALLLMLFWTWTLPAICLLFLLPALLLEMSARRMAVVRCRRAVPQLTESTRVRRRSVYGDVQWVFSLLLVVAGMVWLSSQSHTTPAAAVTLLGLTLLALWGTNSRLRTALRPRA